MAAEAKTEEQQIDDVKISEDRLICSKKELLFNSILYSKQSEVNDVISNCFYYNLKKSKIDHMSIMFSSVENRQKFDSIVRQIVGVRRENNRMFAFVNPSSGMGKGVEIFNEVVKKHLDGSGVEVDYQITEKEGNNSLEEIVKRLDLDNYDALLVVGGDSSLRNVINGIWEKQGKPDPKALRLPNFVMIPVGTGNVLALRWNGSHTVDSAVAALLLGKTVKWQMARMTSSDQQSMDKLSICCVEYGWSIDALHKMQTTTVKGKQKYLYGLIHSVKNHSEPFRVDLELTLSDKDEPLKLDTTLRDCLLLIGDVSLGNNPLKSSNGTLILTSASLGKAKFFLKSMKVASRLYHSRNTPLPFGCSEDSGVQWFVGNVKKMSIKVAEEDNLRSLKHMINLDGDIYNCVPNLEVEFLQEVLPVFYNDTSNL